MVAIRTDSPETMLARTPRCMSVLEAIDGTDDSLELAFYPSLSLLYCGLRHGELLSAGSSTVEFVRDDDRIFVSGSIALVGQQPVTVLVYGQWARTESADGYIPTGAEALVVDSTGTALSRLSLRSSADRLHPVSPR